MTENLSPIEVLKSRQNFADYVEAHSDEITSEILKNYTHRAYKYIVPQLTPNADGFCEGINELRDYQQAYIFWFIANEKEEMTKLALALNKAFSKNYGIFVIKLFENNEKIEFECLVKPELPYKQVINKETPSKQLQLRYWEQYAEICDSLGLGDYQVIPKPQHYQYISIGKSGVQIVQTVNTKNKYIATELFIQSKKEIFENLIEQKEEIEEVLGKLDWQELEGKQSSRIRKYLDFDITDSQQIVNAINTHIKAAEDFHKTFKKYL